MTAYHPNFFDFMPKIKKNTLFEKMFIVRKGY